MKGFLLVVALSLLAIAGLYMVPFFDQDLDTSEVPNRIHLPTAAQAGSVKIKIENVVTLAERIRGLSGRESLPQDTGLLFTFPRLGEHSIWMKDMNFPIDIIWIDDGGVVVHIVEGASPESYRSDTDAETFRSEKKARYVLEVNTGFVDKSNLAVGDQVQFIYSVEATE